MSQSDDEETPSRDDRQPRPSKAARVVELALGAGVDLFHDPQGVAYLDSTDRETGVRETLPVRSRACRIWLSGLLYHADGTPLGRAAASDAVDVLHARAVHDGPQREVSVRLASGDDGAVYVDLGDPAWQAVKITPGGWTVVRDAPVRFRRPATLGALPLPSRDAGGWSALRSLLGFAEGPDWVLLVAWLVGTLHPSGPYPLLGLGGEQGTGKSTLARMLRSLVDPSQAPLRSPPRKEDALVLAARNGHVIGLDNLSGIPEWLSDALCRIATGGGYSARALYTDGDEAVFSDRRPILLTSIEDVATRGDLADRTIPLELPRIGSKHRRSERDLWAEFERIRPKVLGALFDSVATALQRRDEVQLSSRPRMADFAEWIVAAEPALPWRGGGFMAAYRASRARAARTSLEADPVASAIVDLLDATGEWSGKASDLLQALDTLRGRGTPPAGWPRRPQDLGARMRRVAPLLSAIGYDFRRGKGRDRDTYYFSSRKPKRAERAHSGHALTSGPASREHGAHGEQDQRGRATNGEGGGARSERAAQTAGDWLRARLLPGRQTVDEVKEAAEAAGLHWPDVKEARRTLGFTSYQDDAGERFWDLPDPRAVEVDPISVL